MKSFIIAIALALTALGGSAPSALIDPAHRALVRGHQLYFEAYGDWSSAQQRPLLLLHGGGSDVSASFARQLDAFAATHRVIAPEQVGQGHSPDVAGPLSYAAMMEDTAALLEQLHVREVDVVGWSDGGILALMLAAKYPQLVHRVVVSGANIAPDGLLDSELAALRNSAPGIGLTEKLRQLWLHEPTREEINVDLLKQLHQPVLVMVGDHDVIKLAHTLQIYHSLPRAELSVLTDTGHETFSQRPQWVNPLVLKFLAQN